MTFKELIEDQSWIKKDRSNIENVFLSFISELYIKTKTFEEVQEKINCAHIRLCTKYFDNYYNQEFYNDYDIVLKENYTEDEFVKFLQELNINETVYSSHSIIWSKDGKCYWKHEEVQHDDEMFYDWIKHEMPDIHEVCKRKEK